MEKARFYCKEDQKIRCLLCPRRCILDENQVGTCGVRKVLHGELFTTNYGCLAAANWDPIEKKPLYHFHPGRTIFSIGTYGCNLFCSFCQNWTLARGKPGPSFEAVRPQEILDILEREGGPAKVTGVAYTYNEPTVWYEFVYDTARLLHEHGYGNVLVTNGYIGQEPLNELLPYLSAMNIDLKAFNDSFYNKYCHGLREVVMQTVERAVKSCHVEVTCLVIPTLNDSASEHNQMAAWLAKLSPDLVLHYSRYFPQYKLDLPPTSPQVMLELRDVAREHLNYVYLGNIDLPGAADTFCPHCANLLIVRSGYRTKLTGLDGTRCNNCHKRIGIILPEPGR